MSRATNQSVTPTDLIQTLVRTRRTWGLVTVVCMVLATIYALFMTKYWEASQGLVVRQAADAGSESRPGKFSDLYEMRTFQETLLEVAKSRHVLEATIRKIDGLTAVAAIDDETIEKVRRRVGMSPPGGAEFGKTEVFYVSAKDPDRDRAIRFVAELCDQLDRRLRELRQQRADSMIVEIAEQVEVTAQVLDEQTKQLAQFEAGVGSDLGELRMLHSAFSGQSDLRQQVVALQLELRTYDTKVSDAKQLIAQLREAQSEPQRIIATPNSLLTSQPALKRLKNGLVDAQLATARLRGTRMDDHPLVIAAVEAENRIRNGLFEELGSAVDGAEAQLTLDQSRRDEVSAQLARVQSRLANLAELRAEYSNRVAVVESSRSLHDEARKKHSEALAAQAAAKSARLVTRIDKPDTGSHPVGPRRAAVVLLGMVGGLGLGLGWVFLTVGPVPGSGRNEAAQPIDSVDQPHNASAFRTAVPEDWWNQPQSVAKAPTDASVAELVGAAANRSD